MSYQVFGHYPVRLSARDTWVSIPSKFKRPVSLQGMRWPATCSNGHEVTLRAPNQRCPECGAKCDRHKPYYNPKNPDNPFIEKGVGHA